MPKYFCLASVATLHCPYPFLVVDDETAGTYGSWLFQEVSRSGNASEIPERLRPWSHQLCDASILGTMSASCRLEIRASLGSRDTHVAQGLSIQWECEREHESKRGVGNCVRSDPHLGLAQYGSARDLVHAPAAGCDLFVVEFMYQLKKHRFNHTIEAVLYFPANRTDSPQVVSIVTHSSCSHRSIEPTRITKPPK